MRNTVPKYYSPKPNLLNGRVVLVTGASSGIGRAAAKTYAQHGASVILLARSIAKLETLYDEIEQAGFTEPAIYPFNLASATPKDYEELMANIQEHYGHLDGVLHNAGILGSLTPIEHYPLEQWYQVMQVNLNSSFLLTYAALPLLKHSEDASIVFTSAPVGEEAKAYWGAYAVSKFGVRGFMQILADELETNTNIRVNCINPGKVNTNLRLNAYPAEDKENLNKPEDILSIYLYLMGRDSRGITGKTFDAVMEEEAVAV